MSDEEVFLGAIRANPNDETARLVYADWLEERGDARAEFVRVEAELARLSSQADRASALKRRLSELGRGAAPAWLALIERGRIENCQLTLRFRFACPRRWESLQPTQDPLVRGCPQCGSDVYCCDTAAEARRRALLGQCVVIDARLLSSGADVLEGCRQDGRMMILGQLEVTPSRAPAWLVVGNQARIRTGDF